MFTINTYTYCFAFHISLAFIKKFAAGILHLHFPMSIYRYFQLFASGENH